MRGIPMFAKTVAETQFRRAAIPSGSRVRVNFTCATLYGCRSCILRFGLRSGDRRRLFADEAASQSPSGGPAAIIADRFRPYKAQPMSRWMREKAAIKSTIRLKNVHLD